MISASERYEEETEGTKLDHSSTPTAADSSLFDQVSKRPYSADSEKPSKMSRRAKVHVASACVNCKRAHLSCDAKRPCSRCVSANKEVSQDKSIIWEKAVSN